MSFSKLARVGFDYRGTGKTPKSTSSKSSNKSDKNAKSEIYYTSENTSKIDDKENTIRDVTNGIMNDKTNTVIEEFDESFSECTSDIDDEPVTRQTVERYTNHTMRNPNSESRSKSPSFVNTKLNNKENQSIAINKAPKPFL